MYTNNLATLLTRRIHSKVASSFFVNAPPGSGRTTLLTHTAKAMQKDFRNAHVFGLYKSSAQNIIGAIAQDFFEVGFIDQQVEKENLSNISQLWETLNDSINLSGYKEVIIFMELDDLDFDDHEELLPFLSGNRYLEDLWAQGNFHIHVILGGFWEHHKLNDYYKDQLLSFPYTPGVNYLLYNAITLNETDNWLKKDLGAENFALPYHKLIHEITGGYAGLIDDLVKELRDKPLSTSEILLATEKATQRGKYGKRLIKLWERFDDKTKQIIVSLLKHKELPDAISKRQQSLLESSGLIRVNNLVGNRYIVVRSWHVLKLLQEHSDSFCFQKNRCDQTQFTEFVPQLSTFNEEAYRIINFIENSIRNFIVAILLEHDDENEHILQNKVKKEINNTKEIEDAYERALDWRNRNKTNKVENGNTPLIAYLTTRDLAALIRELPIGLEDTWKEIANAIEDIAPIRDAVMHNQIIDDVVLEKLLKLQLKILKLLNYQL